MKAQLNEYDGCFEIALEPETIEEVVTIARMGMNHTMDLRTVSAWMHQDKTASGCVIIGKRKNDSSTIRQKP